jgi:glycosyltransferase involved in cell wall biosynthesis
MGGHPAQEVGEAARARGQVPGRFLIGAVAHNAHLQNLAGALYEAGLLQAFYTGGVDHWRGLAGNLRKLAGACKPDLNSRLARRRITTVPDSLIRSDWKWEAWRLLAGNAFHRPLVEDWLWEKGELSLDRNCARLMGNDNFDAFLGVEHGSLASVKAAKAAGKVSVVTFMSPHHATRAKWEAEEYDRFPELLTEARRSLLVKAQYRDARRDEEAAAADVIQCASNFTRTSLLDAGVTAHKIICVPLGCPEPVGEEIFSVPRRGGVRFLYSGLVSVMKGAPVLLAAWKTAGIAKNAELHFYGRCLMPDKSLAGDNVHIHGPVFRTEIERAYSEASVLVFPTLCDGFGMVVAEAFAHGLPVITTSNAGAADLIVEGKNGFIVPARDVEALAQRMEWCVSHPREVFAMRQEALATARRWNWAAFRKAFINELLEHISCRSN